MWARIASASLMVAVQSTIPDRLAAADVLSDRREGASDVSDRSLSNKYLDHFIALLRDGFAGDAAALTAAERHYRAARTLRPDDPQLEYAYALVLLKNLKHSAAVEHFREAAQQDATYLPARRAVIRETIRLKNYAQAVHELAALAEVVGEPHSPPTDRVETARWMGLAMGFLTSPQAGENVRERAISADAEIRMRLQRKLQEQYDLGKQDALAIEGQLQKDEQTAEAAAKHIQQLKRAQAATRRETYRARRDALLDTREQWDAWFADTTRDLDTRLDQLADAFDTLTDSATSLAESIQTTELELLRLQRIENLRQTRSPQDSEAAASTPPLPLSRMTRPYLARSQEYSRSVTQYWNVRAQRDRIAQAAQVLLRQRSAAERQYRLATGAVAQQVERVQQWDARLKQKMEDAVKAPPSSHETKSVANRSRSFSTYDSFDIDAEQQRLLKSYDQPRN